VTPTKSDGVHEPVLADEVAEYLGAAGEGTYIDMTAGAGGHLARLSEVLPPTAHLCGIDRDPSAVARVKARAGTWAQSASIVHGNYADLDDLVTALGHSVFRGILLDLGLSSDQLDDPSRGFAFKDKGPLDMRFDPGLTTTAADLVNRAERGELIRILREFGQERTAKRLAEAIVRERRKHVIGTTEQLTDIVTACCPPPHRTKTLARVFQALRIAVNHELDHLAGVLPVALDHLDPGGRFAVIAYHSLEDRLIKRFFAEQAKGCVCPPKAPVCICGRKPTIKLITRRVVKPSETEIARNPRARSARLRVAERIAA